MNTDNVYGCVIHTDELQNSETLILIIMLNINLKIEAKKTYLLSLNNANEFNNLYEVFQRDAFILPYKVNKLSKRARRNNI